MAEPKLRECPFCGSKIAPTVMSIAEIEHDDSVSIHAIARRATRKESGA